MVTTTAAPVYTERVLPPGEWPRLAGTEAEHLWPRLDPTRSSVVVIERDGVIVACTVLIQVLHADCVWIAPAHRRHAGVVRRLWTAVQRTAHARWGAPTLAIGVTLDVMRRFMTLIQATKLPGDQFVVRVNHDGH